jgi:hypothetical protein
MSREKGDQLEDLVAHTLNIKKSTNSGAKYDNGDLTNKDLIIECKVKSKDTFQPCGPEIKKLEAQALKHSKDWLYIQKTNKNIYVLMTWDSYLTLKDQADS